jgi:hypothetical protein
MGRAIIAPRSRNSGQRRAILGRGSLFKRSLIDGKAFETMMLADKTRKEFGK